MGEPGGLESWELGSCEGIGEPGGVASDLCRHCVGFGNLCQINLALSDLCGIRVGFATFMSEQCRVRQMFVGFVSSVSDL